MESFSELNLSAPLMKAIAELGYEKPTEIQSQTLPILLGEPTDFLGLAATGTGKTAAFAIPLLERIDPSKKAVQALILCPTRELALQVSGQINLLGKFKGVRAVPVYGGSSYGDQIRGLKQGATVVVGTPGRVVDHMERGTIRLDQLETLILDEADEMISMGFKEALEFVLEAAPKESSNIWLFSATMSREVRKVADAFLRNPEQVQVNQKEMLSGTVEQIYYTTSEHNKPEVLCKLIDAADDFFGLIFCQTKSLVADLTQFLADRGYKVDCLHGDKDQTARERTMQAFRDHKVNILVCTDVASRGLDVKDVSHVINYSIPRELDSYVHRIGRTARSGKTGFAMSLVTASHRVLIGRIERMTKSRMIEGKIPTRRDIGLKKVTKALELFQGEAVAHVRAAELMGETWKQAIAEMSREEIAGRFLALTFPDIFGEREKEMEKPAERSHSRGGHDRGNRESYGPPARGTGTIKINQRTHDVSVKPLLIAKPAYIPRREPAVVASAPAQQEEKATVPAIVKPMVTGKKSYEDKPAYEAKPAYAGKHAYAEKPSYGAKAGGYTSNKPAYGDKPAYGSKPSFPAKPLSEAKPLSDAKPAYAAKKTYIKPPFQADVSVKKASVSPVTIAKKSDFAPSKPAGNFYEKFQAKTATEENSRGERTTWKKKDRVPPASTAWADQKPRDFSGRSGPKPHRKGPKAGSSWDKPLSRGSK